MTTPDPQDTTGILRLRKKPVTVRAVRWKADNPDQVHALAHDHFRVLPELHGDITAQVYDRLHDTWAGVRTGQWVLEGVQGEY